MEYIMIATDKGSLATMYIARGTSLWHFWRYPKPYGWTLSLGKLRFSWRGYR